MAIAAQATRGSRRRALNSHRKSGVVRNSDSPHHDGWKNGGSSTKFQLRRKIA